MKDILHSLDKHFDSIDAAVDELNPPGTVERVEAAEKELGVRFPDEFRHLYRWHDGEKGNVFLFDGYRILPMAELMELNLDLRRTVRTETKQSSDDSGVFKDCIANEKWIAFGDNGGNTILLLDLDPGQQGVYGQILESCDGDVECRFSSIREFLGDISTRISSGEIAWDDDAGCFQETTEESIGQRTGMSQRVSMLGASPNRDQLKELKTGQETTLVGALKPDRRSNRHRLYIKGGEVTVVGDIQQLNRGLMSGPPLVKLKVRVGKKPFFGIGSPEYRILSCEQVSQ